MKKLVMIALVLVMIINVAGCAGEQVPPDVTLEPDSVEELQEPEVVEEEEDSNEEIEAGGSGIYGAIHRVEYGDNVVYLFGTLHGGREEWFPLADVVEDAMRRADIFATEIDFFNAEAMEAAMMDVVLLPDGQSWVDILPREAYEHLVYVVETYGESYEYMRNINPAVIVSTITLQLAESLVDNFEIGATIDDLSVDGYVQGVALELGRPIIGLESVEQQMNIAFNLPADALVDLIMNFFPMEEMMEYLENSEEMSLGEMVYLYETNNLTALADGFALITSVEATIDSPYGIYMREIVMNYRSTYYANVIAGLLRETEEPTTFFVAVGLSHVIRARGGEEFTDIVEQLELLGFEAVPLYRS